MNTETQNQTDARICLDENTQQIEKFKAAIINTKPFVETIFNAYNAVAEIEPVSDELIHGFISDCPGTCDKVQSNWYDQKYRPSHESLGFDWQAGFDMVKNKPDMSGVIAAVREFYNERMTGFDRYCDHELFHIVDGQIAVDEEAVNNRIEALKFYISTEKQKTLYAALQTLADALVAVDDIVRSKGINLLVNDNSAGIGGKPIDSELARLFDIKFDGRFDTHVKVKPSTKFFRTYQ